MIIKDNGERHKRISSIYDKKLHQPYDYERYGLNNRIMSHKIYNTKNPILKYVLNIFEQEVIYCMKYVDILQNYFNYNWKNR